MMHDRFDSLVDLLLAGGLEEAERREAESHATSCSPCGTLLADARAFRSWAAGAIAPDAPPAGLEDRLVARFRAVHAAKPRRSWPRVGRSLKIIGGVAAAALLIALGAAFTDPGMPDSIAYLVAKGKDFESDNAVYPPGSAGWEQEVAQGKLQRIAGKGESRGPAGLSSAVNGRHRLGGTMPAKTWGFTASRDGFLEDVGVDMLNRANQEQLGATRRAQGGVGGAPHGDLSLSFKDGKEAHAGVLFGAKANKLEELVDAVSDGISLDRPPATNAGAASVVVEPPKPPAPKPEAEKAEDLKVDPRLAAAYPPEPIQAGRKLIRNADVTVEVEAYDAALTRINAIVTEEKGFVSSADTERMANGKISATVTLRIPPERFEAVVERFRALGTVRHQSITTQDVTKAYVDLESRLSSKQSLMDRLKKVLAEAKGTVKELMEVEVQMGKTLEDLEAIKGELKYFDNLVGLSTIILRLAEKDLGQPFEVVQTLQSAIGITSAETEAAYARAQKAVADAGGQVIDSNLVRSKDGSAKGTIKAKVDAEKFPALREELRKLGHVDVDTVVDRKTARGGQEGPARPDAPVRKEQAVITLSIVSPPVHVARAAQLSVETADVEGAYLAARKSVEAAGGKVLGGSVTGRTDGTSASLSVQVETGRFVALLDGFRASGKLLQSTSSQAVPPAEGALVSERGQIDLALSSPPRLIGEEHGLGRTIRDTFSGSVAGVLWSVEKLFVGVSLAGPWLALALGLWFGWRRLRRKKSAQASA